MCHRTEQRLHFFQRVREFLAIQLLRQRFVVFIQSGMRLPPGVGLIFPQLLTKVFADQRMAVELIV